MHRKTVPDLEEIPNLKVYMEFWEWDGRQNQLYNDRYKIISRRIAMLSNCIQVETEIVDENSKPMIRTPDGWFFNLSHSGDLMCCAYAQQDIGIDIEQHKNRNFDLIADTWFSPQEVLVIAQQRDPAVFYRMWTQKEAWLKLTGKTVWDIPQIPVTSAENGHCYRLRWKEHSYSLTIFLDGNNSREHSCLDIVQLDDLPLRLETDDS